MDRLGVSPAMWFGPFILLIVVLGGCTIKRDLVKNCIYNEYYMAGDPNTISVSYECYLEPTEDYPIKYCFTNNCPI